MASHTPRRSSRVRKQHETSIAGPGESASNVKKRVSHPLRRPRTTASKAITLCDPVEILPSEIALMCLWEALPSVPWSSSDYPTAIIELTSVSSRWQELLFSAPTLWSQVHVQYSAYDLLVILSIFLHLSGRVPLTLVVWNTLGLEWEDIRSLISPHAHRIHSLVLGNDPPIYRNTPYAGAAYLSLASDIHKSLHLDSLVDLDFGRRHWADLAQLKVLDLPADTCIKNELYATLHNVESPGHLIPLLVNRETLTDLWHNRSIVFDFLHINTQESFVKYNRRVSSFNSRVSSLTRILSLLNCTSTVISSSTGPATFLDITRKECLLCKTTVGSLERALGCARSHFGLRPFRCLGCRSCNAKKGYARFFTSHLLRNHIGPTTCAICGTQQTVHWRHDLGDPICSTCSQIIKPRPIRWDIEETKMLVSGCNKHGVGNWKHMIDDSALTFDPERTTTDLKDRFRTYFPDAYRKHYPNTEPHPPSIDSKGAKPTELPDSLTTFEKSRGKRDAHLQRKKTRALKMSLKRFISYFSGVKRADAASLPPRSTAPRGLSL